MVGPLKGGTHKKKYLLVMVDKFTKWIEAKPVKTAESGPVIDFISGVVHLYGVPHNIITDNVPMAKAVIYANKTSGLVQRYLEFLENF